MYMYVLSCVSVYRSLKRSSCSLYSIKFKNAYVHTQRDSRSVFFFPPGLKWSCLLCAARLLFSGYFSAPPVCLCSTVSPLFIPSRHHLTRMHSFTRPPDAVSDSLVLSYSQGVVKVGFGLLQ